MLDFEGTMFSRGVPKREERRNHGATFIYPEELLDKKCGGCVRCTERSSGPFARGDEKGYRCTMRGRIEIHPEDKACVGYWDKAEHDRAERQHEEDIEKRRQELWAIYAEKPPVKLPIVNDGYGIIPECPVCGEMPYDTEQCHWCGQHFIQDQETVDYATPKEIDFTCPSCGKPGKAGVSKYNGHKHFKCAFCGLSFME